MNPSLLVISCFLARGRVLSSRRGNSPLVRKNIFRDDIEMPKRKQDIRKNLNPLGHGRFSRPIFPCWKWWEKFFFVFFLLWSKKYIDNAPPPHMDYASGKLALDERVNGDCLYGYITHSLYPCSFLFTIYMFTSCQNSYTWQTGIKSSKIVENCCSYYLLRLFLD